MANTIGTPILAGLPDIAADILSFIQSIRKAADPGEYEPFRAKAEELFRSFETRAKESDIPDPMVQLAKFPLVAFIDETILQSNWLLKDLWAGNPLQLQYFNDFSAGEEFFNKLESLRNTDDPIKLDVLEIYYHCMAVGFKGKYADLKGMEKMKVLLESLSKEIRRARLKGADGLSPNWQPTDQGANLVKEFPVWIIVVGCGAVLLILYAVLSTILGKVADGVIQSVS
jgi:type VI secretion system protein ImpK